MRKFKVQLEDNGQDFLEFITDEMGVIIEAKPYQTEIWKGGYIPIGAQEIGDFCMIHKPPYFDYGFLKHKVISINQINDGSN